MKSILKISIVFLSLIIIVSCRKSESNQATTTDWRTSMAAFGKEVVAVAKASEITDASFAITRIREYTTFDNAKGEKIWVIFKQGFGKEFHGELVKHFNGEVSWRGVVEFVETDAKKELHIIEVKFPVPNDVPKGIEFRKEKDDELLEPVWALYGLGSNVGKVLIGVNFVDIEPLEIK